MLASALVAVAPVTGASASPGGQVSAPAPRPVTTSPAAPARKRDPIPGLPELIIGAVVLGGSLATIAPHAIYRKREREAEFAVDEARDDNPEGLSDAEIDALEEERQAAKRVRVPTGVVVGVGIPVGLVLSLVGITRFSVYVSKNGFPRARRRSAFQLGPQLGPQHVGLSLQGRF